MDFFSKNLPYLLAGVSVGGQYALIAIGYTMVYGILRLINFAHGDIFMVAGLVTIYASTVMPLYLSLPLTVIVTVILGMMIEKVAYKPLRNAPRMSVMISAIGVSYLLQNLALYITGGLAQDEGGYSPDTDPDDRACRSADPADQPHKDRYGDAFGVYGL